MTPQATSGATFGLGALSSAVSGFGKVMQGQEQQKAYDYNADVTIQNAKGQAVSTNQKFTETIGKQASRYAASGVDITSGSPLLIMAATASRGAEQEEKIMEAGTEEANLQRYYGKIAAFGGTMSGIGSFMSGLSADYAGYKKATNDPYSGFKDVPDVPMSMFDGVL